MGSRPRVRWLNPLPELPGQDEHPDTLEPGLILPDEKHHLELTGPVRLQIEFYDRPPVEALVNNERKTANA